MACVVETVQSKTAIPMCNEWEHIWISTDSCGELKWTCDRELATEFTSDAADNAVAYAKSQINDDGARFEVFEV